MSDIKTEQEAYSTTCHLSIPIPYSENPEFMQCMASDCMAWRWVPLLADADYLLALEKVRAEFNAATPKRDTRFAPAHLNKNRAKYGLPEEPTHGYCGLAGIPQTVKPLE